VVVTTVRSSGKTESQFESDDTPDIRIFAHDVFPPSIPTGLQAAFSGAGPTSFIDLIWTPDTEVDLAGYNVYRREEGGAPTRINPSLVQVPAFRDSGVTAGHTCFYSVSSVDRSGNESGRSEEASERVP